MWASLIWKLSNVQYAWNSFLQRRFEASNNSQILWRLARAARNFALESHDLPSNRKKELVYEAYNLSKRAIEENENCWASHKWFAITLGDVGDYEGTKMKISNAFKIREHLEVRFHLSSILLVVVFMMSFEYMSAKIFFFFA